MPPSFSIWAGEKALAQIRDSGLRPDDIKVVAGAAGGPKWLVLSHLDRALFTSWLAERKTPLFFIGSSIGAWRLATASRINPGEAIERFEEAYLRQVFGFKPSMDRVNRVIETVLDNLLSEGGPQEILSHPWYRLSIMAVRCKGDTGSDRKTRLLPAFTAAALGNIASRRSLGLFFERALFYDPRTLPPYYSMNGFPIHRVPLHPENLKGALMASGSVPLLMPGVRDIPGAPPGIYRDGGIIDYHMDIPFLDGQDGLILYPHYANRISPGWLDKKLPWRGPEPRNMDRVVLITPSRAFIERLPLGKITDRSDFTQFAGWDKKRVEYWKAVIDEGRRLADEFMEAVESTRIKSMVQPISRLPQIN